MFNFATTLCNLDLVTLTGVITQRSAGDYFYFKIQVNKTKMHLKATLVGLTYLFCVTSTLDCDIVPDDIIKPKNINDIDRYVINIQGNPKTYTPKQKYNVSLKVNPNSMPKKAFKQFFLTLESVDEESASRSYRPTGQFEFDTGPILMQFSDRCPNTVIENSKLPKWEIQVYWVAPSENSGCVAIKATVVESRDNWFSEDGQLTKILCEDSEVDENVKPATVDKCCACSEAKYEVAFEGRWTRNTHPRHYPPDLWSTKFSDIIGASHRKYHSFWNEQDFASEGLKELAEEGKTQSLEAEIKEMGTNIRTIIKARGLQHPNITESSYAVFRTDSNNHLVSLVSKITPSPDWFVGISNFELCKSDCTWAESYTYNLYPVDAGTDDGIGYLSSDPLRFKRKFIMPIKPNNPNDPESPFYNEEGEPMNPVAKIHFTRQRLYDKPCDEDDQRDEDDEDDCATEKWSDWTPCSVPCGLGKRTRIRSYANPRNAENCYVPLVQYQTCQGTASYCRNSGHSRKHKHLHIKPTESYDEMEMEGSKEEASKDESSKEEGDEGANNSKDGDEKDEDGNKKVEDGEEKDEEANKNVEDGEKKNEDGSEEKESKEEQEPEKEASKEEDNQDSRVETNDEDTPDDEKKSQEEKGGSDDCAVGDWSEWSSCSATCGYGTKTRDRKLLRPRNEDKCEGVELQENRRCSGEDGKCSNESQSKCSNSSWGSWSSCSVSCGRGYKRRLRLPFEDDDENSDNQNDDEQNECSNSEVVECNIDCNDSDRLGESLIVEQEPDGRVVNCKTTKWSIWSKCVIHGSSCGQGLKKRYRQITRHAENGGKACPKKLIQSKRCYVPCKASEASEERSVIEENIKPKCVMSEWTDFTPCSSICGSSAMQLKTRKVLLKPPGVVCPPRVMYKPCNLPLACTSDGRPIFL